ncbi:MAG: DUF4065 domain-containing protein [Candidatus Parcubacteria bacterium]|nr:DUF4065 domain-containing protein [Candidatus Parcubacteria bacterium]
MATQITKSPYKAENVAKYLIYLASQAFVGDNKEKEGITNLKLQKILYFMQAYYLAKLNKPLFSDELEAWKYGPVVPELYRKFRRFGNNPIISEGDKSTLTEEDKEILKKVWDTFGGYSASRLVDIVHAHTPWKEANASVNKIMSQKAIKDYYGSLLNK